MADSARQWETVRRFVVENIGLMEDCELVLLLARNPTRAWTPADAAQHIGALEPLVHKRLAYLCSRKLARQEGEAFVFAPADEKVAATVGLLADAYRTRRGEITLLVFSEVNQRLSAFADAFRLRKKDTEDDS